MTTVTLKSPIELKGVTYKELTFREAETGDVMLADRFEGQVSKSIVILAAMADIPLQAFQKIKMKDLNIILEETASLLGEPTPEATGD